ncbi:MAG: hypothetical protein ACR2O6_07605 [Ilumatobacteraceae bacterium]
MADPGADLERSLRRDLAAVDAQLADIPSDRFAERSPLLKQRDQIAADLREVVAADPETLARWADRAGGKDTSDGTKPFIPSHIESGSM